MQKVKINVFVVVVVVVDVVVVDVVNVVNVACQYPLDYWAFFLYVIYVIKDIR